MLAQHMLWSVSVCVCVSVTSRCHAKRLNGYSRFLERRLPSTYPVLCFKKIRITPEIRVLPSGILSKMLDLGENFVAAAGHA